MKSIIGVIGAAMVLVGCSSVKLPCEGNDVDGYDCEGNPVAKPVAETKSASDVQLTVSVQAEYQQKIVIEKDGRNYKTLTGSGIGNVYNASAPAGSYSAKGYWREGTSGSWKDSDSRMSKDGKCSVYEFDDKGPKSKVDFNDIVLRVCPK